MKPSACFFYSLSDKRKSYRSQFGVEIFWMKKVYTCVGNGFGYAAIICCCQDLIGLILWNEIWRISNNCVCTAIERIIKLVNKRKSHLHWEQPHLRIIWNLPRDFIASHFLWNQRLPETMRFIDNFSGKCRIFGFTIEGKFVFWFSIGDFVNLIEKWKFKLTLKFDILSAVSIAVKLDCN